MIKEHGRKEFIELYKYKCHLIMRQRKCCKSDTRIEYYSGYGVRLSCMCGESCLTLKRADFPEVKTEEEFAGIAVKAWNDGQNDAWY